MRPSRLRGPATLALLAVLLALPMGVVGAASALPPARPFAPGASGGDGVAPAATDAASVTGLTALVLRDHAILARDHVPARDVFMPNFRPEVSASAGVLRIPNSTGPVPMGIGDVGVQTVNGTTVGTVSYTSSIEGILHINSMNASYVNGDGVDSISSQLNTVLTGVDLFGNTSYQFWIQNVPVYTIHTEGFGLVDNIWNFSNNAFDFTPNSLYSYDGVEISPVYYYASGPVFHLPMPFTVRLYNNASVVQDRPTVYLNYSITAANGTVYSGSYDRVEFNSTGLTKPHHPAPAPSFQIDGKKLGATGFIPNDAELMIGGWDDGSTQTFTAINATMQLFTEPNGTHRLVSVPSAYDRGFETGETAEGITEWASPGVAHLGPGPSFTGPLWGIAGGSFGHEDLRVNVTPANAFLFVARGATFRDAAAAWAPLPASGSEVLEMPVGTYALEALLSDHHASGVTTATGSGSVGFALPADPAAGVYTPLWAWGNGQLPAISQSGNGTAAAPYVLDNAPGTISPLFGEFNDYIFPVFAGVFLAYTTAHVEILSPPSFSITYTLPTELVTVNQFGTPSTNTLELQTLNTSHVSILKAAVLTGWQGAFDIGEPLSSVLIWNSTSTLVADNSFQDEGIALTLFGGGANTIWGNTFTAATAAAPTPGALLNGSDQVGVLAYSSHNLVYNNYFDVPLPAVTPELDITTFLPAVYHDRWNVTPAPATAVRVVNGIGLSGNILGLSTQGGNYWSNYGDPANPYGVVPYTDGGLISRGGDQDPLLSFALYPVTFHERGLRAGALWSVTLNGTTRSSNATTLLFWEPNGTYAYTVARADHRRAAPAYGAVSVRGAAAVVTVRFV